MALHVSVQGDSLNVSESKKVMLRALEPGVFIQTDKAVYKPGQEGEGVGGTPLLWGHPWRGPGLAPALTGNGRDHPGMSWSAQHRHGAMPGLAGGLTEGLRWVPIHLPMGNFPPLHLRFLSSEVPSCLFGQRPGPQ